MKIRIKNSQKKININEGALRRLGRGILKIKGIKNVELSILLVGKNRMRILNKKFRNQNQVTDVLAFRMQQEKGPDRGIYPLILGDVVICPEMACKFAKSYNTTEEEEIYLYLIHGVLHLLGYDDIKKKDRILMEKEQIRILKKISKKIASR